MDKYWVNVMDIGGASLNKSFIPRGARLDRPLWWQDSITQELEKRSKRGYLIRGITPAILSSIIETVDEEMSHFMQCDPVGEYQTFACKARFNALMHFYIKRYLKQMMDYHNRESLTNPTGLVDADVILLEFSWFECLIRGVTWLMKQTNSIESSGLFHGQEFYHANSNYKKISWAVFNILNEFRTNFNIEKVVADTIATELHSSRDTWHFRNVIVSPFETDADISSACLLNAVDTSHPLNANEYFITMSAIKSLIMYGYCINTESNDYPYSLNGIHGFKLDQFIENFDFHITHTVHYDFDTGYINPYDMEDIADAAKETVDYILSTGNGCII